MILERETPERISAMWGEAGIQFRSNTLLEAGSVIPLHAHSYDHVALVTHGWFAVREELPDGSVKEYQMASRGLRVDEDVFAPIGYRVLIPAGHKHTFTLLGQTPGEPAEVLCLWASSEKREGC